MWTIVLAVAAGAVVVLQAWGAIDAVGWDDLEDRSGPSVPSSRWVPSPFWSGADTPGRRAGPDDAAVRGNRRFGEHKPLSVIGGFVASGILFLLSTQLEKRAGRTSRAAAPGEGHVKPA